jgi:hypothetical protein
MGSLLSMLETCVQKRYGCVKQTTLLCPSQVRQLREFCEYGKSQSQLCRRATGCLHHQLATWTHRGCGEWKKSPGGRSDSESLQIKLGVQATCNIQHFTLNLNYSTFHCSSTSIKILSVFGLWSSLSVQSVEEELNTSLKQPASMKSSTDL